ncbi:jg23840, partial [Pararge aegeria aegeria]
KKLFVWRKHDNSKSDVAGGGTLIHPSVVLTVAHICDSNQQLQVLTSGEDRQTRVVKQVVMHERYKRGGRIGIKRPICPPAPGERTDQTNSNSKMWHGKARMERSYIYHVTLMRSYSALRVQYNNVLRAVLKPRRCSASEMFGDARVDDFYAIIRKRAASMMSRLVSSTNTLLSTLACRLDSSL